MRPRSLRSTSGRHRARRPVVGELQIGQDATPGDQLEGQVGGLRGEAEVRGEDDIRLPRDHRAPRVRSAEGEGQTRRVAGIEGKSRRRPLRQGLARPR